jgi:hypothetical protein
MALWRDLDTISVLIFGPWAVKMPLPKTDITDLSASPNDLKELRADILRMHAELTGKLRAGRKALRDEQAALQKEREAHICTLTVQEALIEELARHATKEATESAFKYVQGQKDRIKNASERPVGVPLRLDEEAEMNAALQKKQRATTVCVKRRMDDSTEENGGRKRFAPNPLPLGGPISQSESPESLQRSYEHSEMFNKRLNETFNQTQDQGADIASFDGSKDEVRPRGCVVQTSAPVSGSTSSAPSYGLRHRRPNDRYFAFTAVTRRRSERSAG